MEFPPHWTHEELCERLLRELLIDQKRILENQEKQMSALATLQAALTQALTDLTTLQNDVNAFIAANTGGATDAELATLTTAVQGLDTQVKAIDAIINPPAPPAA